MFKNYELIDHEEFSPNFTPLLIFLENKI